MNRLFDMAEQILISRVISSQFPLTGKSKLGLVSFCIAGLLFLVSLGFFITAAHIWYTQNFASETAAMLTGGTLLFISLMVSIVTALLLNIKRMRQEKMQEAVQSEVQTAIALVKEELAELVSENPKTALLLASVAGYLAGKKIENRL